MAVAKRCNRCGHKQRNDGTAENPEWVCDRRGCVKYKPPKTEPAPETPSGSERMV